MTSRDTADITERELNMLHKEYKRRFNEIDTDNPSDLSDSDDDNIEETKFTIKPIERVDSKKQTTMLYMFKKYEQLQNECNTFKNRLYKMRIRAHSQEQKQHYQNLEFSNLILDKRQLQEQLHQKRWVTTKYYFSLSINVILCAALAYVYKEYIESV